MALEIIKHTEATDPFLVADRRLFLDETQTKLVEEGTPEAAFMFCAPGHKIHKTDAARLGLHEHDGRIVQGKPEAEPELAPEKTDKESKPDERKHRTPAENKGGK